MSNERYDGINIIKIIATLFVIGLHLIGQGGLLNSLYLQKRNVLPITTVYALMYTCINLFALSTGFLMFKKKRIRSKRITNIFLITIFYSLLISLICYSFNMFNVRNMAGSSNDMSNFLIYGNVNYNSSKYLFFGSIFQIFFGNYWFISSYILLLFLIPYLNGFIENIDQKKFKQLLIIMFLFISVYTTIALGIDIFRISGGYSPFWLVYIYLIGAYIGKYHADFKLNKKSVCVLISVILLCLFASSLGNVILNKYELKNNVSFYYICRFIDHISPFNLITSICVFLLLFKIRIKSKFKKTILNFFSGESLFVYIIHANNIVYFHLLFNLLLKQSTLPFFNMISVLFLYVVGIYFICVAFDLIFRIIPSKLYQKIRS